jgi:hypothetical protein
MAFPVATGAGAYTGNFIPEIWASKLIVNFYDSTVLNAISNTDYEGEIKGMGDKVNIRTTPELTVRQYEQGMTLQVERPDKPKIVLNIDQGDYFAAIEDDVDKVQADINLLDAWTKDASERMKIRIDSVVLTGILPDIDIYNKGATAGRISQNINLGATAAPVQLTKTNVLDYIIDMGVVLDEANAPSDNRFLVIPAWVAGLIKKSDLKDASLSGDAQSIMRNGRLGMINDMTLYVSHNLNKVLDSTFNCFSILGGNKMGLTFATQMTEMESIRAESTFGNIIRGLQVYGYKVTKGPSLARLYARQ